jgi:hypothetical protein
MNMILGVIAVDQLRKMILSVELLAAIPTRLDKIKRASVSRPLDSMLPACVHV